MSACDHPNVSHFFRYFSENPHLPHAVDIVSRRVCNDCGMELADVRFCKVELISFEHNYPSGNKTVNIDAQFISRKHVYRSVSNDEDNRAGDNRTD